jgi:hypothetical protein
MCRIFSGEPLLSSCQNIFLRLLFHLNHKYYDITSSRNQTSLYLREAMQTRAQVFHGNLTDQLADFQAKFPWIDAPYLLSFNSDIATSKSFQIDQSVQNSLRVITEDINASVAEGMRGLDGLDIYARLAFPDSRAKQRVFGQDTWDKARDDQEKMISALTLANSFADAAPYKAALLAKGMTQGDIDNLATVAANIELKNTLQEKAKSGRPVTTEDRIQVNNIVWKRMQTISICSELVWRDDYARRIQYLLYPHTTQGPSATREGDVNSGSFVNIDISGITFTPQTTVSIFVTGSSMRFYFSFGAGNPPGPLFFDRAPGSETMSIDDFKTATGFASIPGTAFLNVQNFGAVTGHYKIVFHDVA